MYWGVTLSLTVTGGWLCDFIISDYSHRHLEKPQSSHSQLNHKDILTSHPKWILKLYDLFLFDRTAVLMSSYRSRLPPQRNVSHTCEWQSVLNLRSVDFSLDIWPKLCNCLLYVLLEVNGDEVNEANLLSWHWCKASFLRSAFTLKLF